MINRKEVAAYYDSVKPYAPVDPLDSASLFRLFSTQKDGIFYLFIRQHAGEFKEQ